MAERMRSFVDVAEKWLRQTVISQITANPIFFGEELFSFGFITAVGVADHKLEFFPQ